MPRDRPLDLLAQRIARSASREGRIELLAEAARTLIASGTESGLFAGSVLQNYLQQHRRRFDECAGIRAKNGDRTTHDVLLARHLARCDIEPAARHDCASPLAEVLQCPRPSPRKRN